MTVVVFTFVLLLGNGLKDILPLLVNGQASLWVVLQAVGLLIPFVLVFALPMGMLTATLLFFGRLSADQELTAIRAGGVSLLALITPIILLSVFLAGCAAWLNLEVAPKCRVAFTTLRDRAAMTAGTLLEDQPMQIGDYTVYVKKIRNNKLEDISIIQLNEKMHRWFKAENGKVERQTNQIVVTLFEAYGATQEGSRVQPIQVAEMPFTLDSTAKNSSAMKVSDMSFIQLRKKIQELDRASSQAEPLEKIDSAQLREKLKQLRTMRKDLAMPARVQMHRMVSFSFACIGFTLIGIPLGIRAHRKETSAGIAMALFLVLIYYSFIILGQSLDRHAELAPHLIVWLPNFIFQAVGAVLLWRANKGI